MKTIFLITIFVFLASGCATAYQPHGMSGGFSERQISDDSFHVRFNGNGFTHRDRAKDFALLRSAEVTLNRGYKYFVIVDSEERAYRMSHTTPVTSSTEFSGTVSDSGFGMSNVEGTATTTYSGGQTITFVKPTLDNFIVCFRERPINAGLVYDANRIANQIKAQYSLK